MDSTQLKTKSPYRRGADHGAVFGVYLAALFFATAYSVDHPLLALAAMAMMLVVPLYIFATLRRSFIADRGETQFSSLWMEGIATFFFGGLIASIVAMVYMRWVEPGFFDERVDTLIAIYSSMDLDQAQEAADMLLAARDQKLLPKPIEITVDMLWLIVFTGSLLSMAVAWLVQLMKPKASAPRSNQPTNQP